MPFPAIDDPSPSQSKTSDQISVLCEELGQVIVREYSALGQTSMVLVVELVGSGHYRRWKGNRLADLTTNS